LSIEIVEVFETLGQREVAAVQRFSIIGVVEYLMLLHSGNTPTQDCEILYLTRRWGWNVALARPSSAWPPRL
jgi:hypothetical protein